MPRGSILHPLGCFNFHAPAACGEGIDRLHIEKKIGCDIIRAIDQDIRRHSVRSTSKEALIKSLLPYLKHGHFYPDLKFRFAEIMGVVVKKDKYAICDECGSEFLKSGDGMMALCPECAHILYGYPNCSHVFKNGRCIYCYWDGSRSEYIEWLINGN